MDGHRDENELQQRAHDTCRRLRGVSHAELAAAKVLVEELRNAREYESMGMLAEAISRRDPADVKTRRLYAQYLIETGKVTAAVDMLERLRERLVSTDAEFADVTGLLGRAHKQVFFEAPDKTTASAREALSQAITAYQTPYEQDPSNTWHGVNLAALLNWARRVGVSVASDLRADEIARRVVATLRAAPIDKRGEWYLPTLAEASLALNDWDAVEANVHAYVAGPEAKAFQIASTLRQFTQVWDVEAMDERGRGLVLSLRARLMQVPGGQLDLAPHELRRMRVEPSPDAAQLEAVLGPNGTRTYAWMRTGLTRASSVASVRQRLGSRVGTGFLVRAGAFGRQPADEVLVLTNFHVVNELGVSPGIRPQAAEVVLEAVDANLSYPVRDIVWSSPIEQHDASLLRLSAPIGAPEPLPFGNELPRLDCDARVYIIGHPGGRDLAFSFQDNEVLDHEGPPNGKPALAGVCRIHYRAPTEGGSSGSPVFNDAWEVVALHHKGGKIGMPKLNGQPGTYGANEGIGIGCIVAAMP